MGSDIDLAEARTFQNAAHAVGVSEREWAGRVRVVSGLRWQMSGRGLERQDVERFSSNARQQTKARRPFGLRLRRMLINAAAGSAKNITPNREKAASNEAGSNGNTSASAWTNRTPSHPSAARCANVSTAADRSIPTTVPSGATARTRSSAVSPPPQPMSRTLSPGCGASTAKPRRPSGASCSSKNSRTSAHAPTRTSSGAARVLKTLSELMMWTRRHRRQPGRGRGRVEPGQSQPVLAPALR
jgi:hypothetical protein